MQAQIITPVASHPIALRGSGMTNRPITFLLAAMIMIITINGAATIPLRTAAQKSALTGSILIKLSAKPSKVAIVIAA